jgi:sortase A
MAPGNIDPQNIIVDPTVQTNVGPDSKLIIPKINVEVPIAFGVGNDYNSQMKAMESGVANFSIPGASSVPGQVGNTVIAGHSSNDAFVNGDYKFIFAQNEKLQTGDTIYVNYQGKRYTYSITKKEVVLPEEVNKLVYPTDKPVLTLISCVPLGTALKRLLITAEQVSPDPAVATTAPTAASAPKAASIPGSEPTFLERIFGGGQ